MEEKSIFEQLSDVKNRMDKMEEVINKRFLLDSGKEVKLNSKDKTIILKRIK
jgi:hypothetical protein